LGLPALEWLAALSLLGMPQEFFDYLGNAVCLAQASAPRLPRGRGDLLQRSEGQEHAGPLARPGHVLQGGIRARTQASRGDGKACRQHKRSEVKRVTRVGIWPAQREDLIFRDMP